MHIITSLYLQKEIDLKTNKKSKPAKLQLVNILSFGCFYGFLKHEILLFYY